MTNSSRRGANLSRGSRAEPAVDPRRSAAAKDWRNTKKEAEAERDLIEKAEGRRRPQALLLGNSAAASAAGKSPTPPESSAALSKTKESSSTAVPAESRPTMTVVPVDGDAAEATAGDLSANEAPPADNGAGDGGGDDSGAPPNESAATTCDPWSAAGRIVASPVPLDGSDDLPGTDDLEALREMIASCDQELIKRTFKAERQCRSIASQRIPFSPKALCLVKQYQARRLTSRSNLAETNANGRTEDVELIGTITAETNKNYCSDNKKDGIPTLAGTCRASGSRRGVAKPMRELAAAKAQIRTMSEPCLTAYCEEMRSPFDGSSGGPSSPSGSGTISAPATLGGTAMGPSTDVAG